ncbi:hypothetical protein IWQ61_008598 [Dispira simplex]|nr:hypothetical protein IWQ61_008598 [Dispira simplex]
MDKRDSGIYVILFTEYLLKCYLQLCDMVGTDTALSFYQNETLWDVMDDNLKTPAERRLEIKVLIRELQVGGDE